MLIKSYALGFTCFQIYGWFCFGDAASVLLSHLVFPIMLLVSCSIFGFNACFCIFGFAFVFLTCCCCCYFWLCCPFHYCVLKFAIMFFGLVLMIFLALLSCVCGFLLSGFGFAIRCFLLLCFGFCCHIFVFAVVSLGLLSCF